MDICLDDIFDFTIFDKLSDEYNVIYNFIDDVGTIKINFENVYMDYVFFFFFDGRWDCKVFYKENSYFVTASTSHRVRYHNFDRVVCSVSEVVELYFGIKLPTKTFYIETLK